MPRSYIGELLPERLLAVLDDPEALGCVLDLCTGSGCLAILAALAYPAARIDATDISAGALEVARRNVADYGLQDRITVLHALAVVAAFLALAILIAGAVKPLPVRQEQPDDRATLGGPTPPIVA